MVLINDQDGYAYLVVQDKMNEICTIAHRVKRRIELLDKDNKEKKKMKGQGKGSANERTRTTITAGLKKKLKEMMAEFSELRARIHHEYRDVVDRRVYTVTGKLKLNHAAQRPQFMANTAMGQTRQMRLSGGG